MSRKNKIVIGIIIAAIVLISIITACVVCIVENRKIRKELKIVATKAKIVPPKIYIDNTKPDPINLKTAFVKELERATGKQFVVVNKLVDARLKASVPKVQKNEALYIYSKDFNEKLGAVFVIYNLEKNEVKVSIMNP